jgi:hypothetical protein
MIWPANMEFLACAISVATDGRRTILLIASVTVISVREIGRIDGVITWDRAHQRQIVKSPVWGEGELRTGRYASVTIPSMEA